TAPSGRGPPGTRLRTLLGRQRHPVGECCHLLRVPVVLSVARPGLCGGRFPGGPERGVDRSPEQGARGGPSGAVAAATGGTDRRSTCGGGAPRCPGSALRGTERGLGAASGLALDLVAGPRGRAGLGTPQAR